MSEGVLRTHHHAMRVDFLPLVADGPLTILLHAICADRDSLPRPRNDIKGCHVHQDESANEIAAQSVDKSFQQR